MKNLAISLMIALFAYSCFSQNKQMKPETISVKMDSVFSIRLSAVFGEGYSWRLINISDSTNVKFIKHDQLPGVQDKDGGPESQIFYFKGDKKGKCTLEFIYEQPWLKEKSPKLNHKTYVIVIHKSLI